MPAIPRARTSRSHSRSTASRVARAPMPWRTTRRPPPRTWATCTSAGLVQVAGVIGDDPFGYAPNQVDMYHFTVTGTGNDSLVAEVFAGRIGSPLDPGVSLFRLEPDGSLQFLAGNNNTDNPVATTVGNTTPLYTDSALYCEPDGRRLLPRRGRRLEHAFAERRPDARQLGDLRSQPARQRPGRLDHGPLRLECARPAGPHPPARRDDQPECRGDPHPAPDGILRHVRPADEHRGGGHPDLPGRHAGHRARPSTSRPTTGRSTTSLGLESYDPATDTATFVLLDALPDGDYQLHLSGADGLADLGGNPLVGNDPERRLRGRRSRSTRPRAATGGTRLSGATRRPTTRPAIPRISASSSRTSSRPGSPSRAISARTPPRPRRIRRTSISSRSS